jgi:hypothetical protein
MRPRKLIKRRVSTGTPIDADVIEPSGLFELIPEFEQVTYLEETAHAIASGGFKSTVLGWVRGEWHAGVGQVKLQCGSVLALAVDIDVVRRLEYFGMSVDVEWEIAGCFLLLGGL